MADDDLEALVEAIAACRAAPDDDAAVAALIRWASATARWDAVVGEAERLAVELAADGEAALAARWWTRVGGWYATRLGDLEAAMQAYEAAVAADPSAVAALEALIELYGETGSSDEHRGALARLSAVVDREPDHVEAALALGAALVTAAELASDAAAPALWREADRRYRALVARQRARLSDSQLVAIGARLGGIARTLGDAAAAEAAFREVIEREPLHAAAREALVELAEARGDWRAVIAIRRAEVEALASVAGSAARRARLLEQIGDAWHDKLADTDAAIAAYEQAAALAPARGLLHKLLEAVTAVRAWPRAIEVLERLIGEEALADRRARFHFAAAVIARDELGDPARAIAALGAALDDDPHSPGVLAALVDALSQRAAWPALARAYRRQIERLGDGDPAGQRALWCALGALCADRLEDRETAIAAYQVALELADDAATREALLELYLAAGPARRRDAIGEAQRLLARAPGRIELYKLLAALYAGDGAADPAWCAAQVLVVLGAASPDEARRFARHKPHGFAPAARRLGDEHWRELAHLGEAGEDRRIAAVFAAAGGAIARATAEPVEAFGLAADAEVDVARDLRAVSRIVAAVSRVLAIDPPPRLWLDAGAGVRVAHTHGAPSLLVGEATIGRASPSELAFAVGKHLAYLRPERFVALAVPTAARLDAALSAALAGDAALGLPRAVLDALAELAPRLADRDPNAIATWRAATDLTANRAGLVVANDLDAAVRAIATEGATLSGLSVKDRIRDLLAFAVSEPYFALRRHLGHAVRDDVAAGGEAPGQKDPGYD
ncbi:MAG TPA: hypothetical protein VFP84_14490, partial [Kofleriaceae bacterium]|nr:hypothetical protein [Kofleriaceae bacterium]